MLVLIFLIFFIVVPVEMLPLAAENNTFLVPYNETSSISCSCFGKEKPEVFMTQVKSHDSKSALVFQRENIEMDEMYGLKEAFQITASLQSVKSDPYCCDVQNYNGDWYICSGRNTGLGIHNAVTNFSVEMLRKFFTSD